MTHYTYDRSSRQIVSTIFGRGTVGLDDYGSRIGDNWSSASAPVDEPHAYSLVKVFRNFPLTDCQQLVRVFDHWSYPPGRSKIAVYRDEFRYARGTVSTFGSVSFPDGYPSNVESRLNAKLASKIRSAAASLLVTAGEAGETIYMLRDAIRRLSGFCWSLYKKQWRRAARFLFPRVPAKTVYYHARKFRKNHRSASHRTSYAKTLLEYEFGWRPLAKDIESMQDALVAVMFKSRPVKVKAKTKTMTQMKLTGMTASVNTLVRTDRKTLWIEAAITPFATAGLTFPDLITAMYNLIPFSFVVDWAWNLNSFLDTWATKTQVRPLYTQRSYLETYEVSGFTYVGPKGYDRWYFTSDNGTRHNSVRYERAKIVPGWELAMPPFTPHKMVEFRHLADTLALCRERFRHITFRN